MDPILYAIAGAGVTAVLAIALIARSSKRRRDPPPTSIERTVAQVSKQVTPLILGSIEAVTSSSIGALASWADSHRGDLRRRRNVKGELTLMFSDIEDSTAINHELGDRRWLKLLRAHDSIVRNRVESHGGEVVKTQGDGFMVTFPDADEALRCAVEIQRELAAGKGKFKKRPIRVRIGLHSGEAIARDGDVFGRNVALAARVADQAAGGEILASAAVRDIADEVDGDGGEEGISFGKPREVKLKGVPGKHVLLPVAWEQAG
jgi:class 3 adenylate cyclase